MGHRVKIVRAPIDGVYTTQSRSGQRFAKHFHDVFGFGLLEDGAQSWLSGRGRVEAYPGTVISTNPGEVHDGRPIGAERQWRIVSIEPGVMAAFSDSVGGDIEIARPVIDHPDLVTAVRTLFARIDTYAAGLTDRLAVEESLAEACTTIALHHARPLVEQRAPATLGRVRDRLAQVDLPTPSLGELGRLAGLSRFQVLRAFQRAYGLSPHSWMRHHRLEHARRLIRNGTSLSQAAAIAGFSDQSHMTRIFVRQYGYAPGVWRAAHTRNGIQDGRRRAV